MALNSKAQMLIMLHTHVLPFRAESYTELRYTVKTEVCCAHCWCVHRDIIVSMHTPMVCTTRFYSVDSIVPI
jgi:hypothetical protein